MTERDEGTIPDTPEKAHGDVLDELVVDRPEGDAEQAEADEQS